jgi:hypothetical protein
MPFYSYKYLNNRVQRKIAALVMLMIFSGTARAQITQPNKETVITATFNPLLVAAYKKPVRLMTMYINPSHYKKYTAIRGGELMHWPSYPLTTGQIIARNEEWQRRNNKKIGEQIASDIIKSNVNKLIYGKKMPVAVAPKF